MTQKLQPSNSQVSPYQLIVETSPEILLTLDQEMKIEFVNPAWHNTTGFDTSKTLGNSLLDFVAQEDHAALLNDWRARILDGGVNRQEFRLQTRNQALRWMSMLTRTIQKDDGKRLVTCALIDITDRKQMEMSLRRSEERYALLASSTTDGIWDWDLGTDQVYFSPRWKAMIGFEDHELENHFSSWYEKVHPDDIKAVMADVADCLQNKKSLYENIYRMRHRDGSWRWILARGIVLRDEAGQAYRMIGSHADISLLKKTEETLLQRENELHAIVNISPDGIVTITEQGNIQSANPAFLEMTGFDADQLLGLSEQAFEQSLHAISGAQPRHKPRYASNTQLYVIDLKKLRNHPLHRQSDTGDKSAQSHTPKLRVLSRTERPLHHFGIAKILYFRDISVESEVDQMKSQFLSTAAHELRTPMASVFGFSELLLSREFDVDTRNEILRTIHQQSESLVNMLTQLLDLARIESRMDMDFCFVHQPLWPIVLRAIAELLIPGDTRKVKFKKPRKDFQVEVDADKLRQVIKNVLVNAYKYSPNGGEICLSIQLRKDANGIDFVGIIISDQGLGMNEEQLVNIYDRFWRADNSGSIPGTGLGMSLVKEIMDIHQGQITIDSQPGMGTRVSLWLKTIDIHKK